MNVPSTTRSASSCITRSRWPGCVDRVARPLGNIGKGVALLITTRVSCRNASRDEMKLDWNPTKQRGSTL